MLTHFELIIFGNPIKTKLSHHPKKKSWLSTIVLNHICIPFQSLNLCFKSNMFQALGQQGFQVL